MMTPFLLPAQNLWWAQPPQHANSLEGMGGAYLGRFLGGRGAGMPRPMLHPSISYEDLLRLMAQMYGERR